MTPLTPLFPLFHPEVAQLPPSYGRIKYTPFQPLGWNTCVPLPCMVSGSSGRPFVENRFLQSLGVEVFRYADAVSTRLSRIYKTFHVIAYQFSRWGKRKFHVYFKRILCYKDVNQVERTGKQVEIKYGVHLNTQTCHWPCTLIELN